MLIFSDQAFVGANLALHPKRLGAGFGAVALNMRLGSLDLRPWNAAAAVYTVPGGGAQRRALYRMGRATPSDTEYWLSSVNDVDYVRSLLAEDTAERTYYTGESEPRVTDNVLALAGAPYPTAYRTLGVPAPEGVMLLSILSAGTGNAETRAYLDTFVTDRGEESAPNAAPQSITVNASGTVSITDLPAAPGGSHGITLRRIYVSTGGDYRLIVQQAVGLTTATDNLTRGLVLQSGGATSRPAWLTPPAGLRGLIGLWNGMIGGFVGKSLRVCFPYRPHAWPIEYEQLVTDDVVATGHWLQNWLVLTTARPRLFVGSSPTSLSEVPGDLKHGCVAKKSVVSMGHGVCWGSGDGLAYVGQNGRGLVTEGVILPAQWRAQFNPTTLVGARIERYYYGSYVDPATGLRKAFLVDPLQPSSFIQLDQGAHAAFYDDLQEVLYLLDAGNVVRRWDAGSALTVRYRSRIHRHPYETNPGAVRVVADTYPVTFRLYSERIDPVTSAVTRVLRHQQSIARDKPYPLPSGYVAQDFQYEVEAGGPVQAVLVGEQVGDLGSPPA